MTISKVDKNIDSETTRINDNQKKRKENVEFYQDETSEARTLMMPSDECSISQPIRRRAFWRAFESRPSSAASADRGLEKHRQKDLLC
jgi:hypothetical protein